jgi:putative transposase
LLLGLSKYFVEYNGDRPHLTLGNKTPDDVYQSAIEDGAKIVDKYGAKQGFPVALRFSGTAFRKDNRNRIKKIGAAPTQLYET